MNPIPLSEIIAYNNTKAGIRILEDNGIRVVARNEGELAQQLSQFLSTHRETALSAFAEHHPDKDLILAYHQLPIAAAEPKSNACGCSGFVAESTSGCDGNKQCAGCAAKKQESHSNADAAATNVIRQANDNDNHYRTLTIIGVLILGAIILKS